MEKQKANLTEINRTELTNHVSQKVYFIGKYSSYKEYLIADLNLVSTHGYFLKVDNFRKKIVKSIPDLEDLTSNFFEGELFNSKADREFAPFALAPFSDYSFFVSKNK